MQIPNEFPFETYVPLEKEEHFVGRIVINKINEGYFSEIDIVNRESKKIFYHVGQLFDRPDFTDLLDLSVQRLSEFLSKTS